MPAQTNNNNSSSSNGTRANTATTTTMKAMAFDYNTSKFASVDISRPTMESDEVLIKVQYAAIDSTGEAVMRKEMIRHFVHAKTKPFVIGWHFGGRVVDAGKSVDDLIIGDQVWGFFEYTPETKQGSFAEYIAVKATQCAKKPDSVDLATATAASTECITALQAIRDDGGLLQERRLPSSPSSPSSSSNQALPCVLVLGAGGAVGSVAVQIAKRLGAHVTAVCSTKDVKRVESLGADAVIDRKKTKNILGSKSSKYDVIFDTPSMYFAPKCMRHLKNKGAYVATLPSVGLFMGKFVSIFNGKSSMFIECKSRRDDLELIGAMLEDGMCVDICSTFKIKDINRAIVKQADRNKIGRVVIEVEGGW